MFAFFGDFGWLRDSGCERRGVKTRICSHFLEDLGECGAYGANKRAENKNLFALVIGSGGGGASGANKILDISGFVSISEED